MAPKADEVENKWHSEAVLWQPVVPHTRGETEQVSNLTEKC